MSARLGEDGVELVVAGGDAVEALEPAEEPLDFAATPVERAVAAQDSRRLRFGGTP